MAGQYFESRDAKTANLHIVMSVIEHKLAALPGTHDAETIAELRSFWGELVTLLALPANHELRECPSCHQMAMRAATRCGHCWTKLAKLVPPAATPTSEGVAIVRGND
jgi:hypothetical protein